MKSLFESLNIFHYLNQSEWWYPNGKPRVQIATEMNDGWRVNAANWLVKNAAQFESAYSIEELSWLESGCGGLWLEIVSDGAGNPVVGGPVSMMPRGDMACDAFEREQDERIENPEEWIKTTSLYKALIGEESDG
jgi:hypothetical protein